MPGLAPGIFFGAWEKDRRVEPREGGVEVVCTPIAVIPAEAGTHWSTSTGLGVHERI